MNRYLIDSSVFVAILRGEDKARMLYGSLTGELVTSAICLAELYEGVFRSKKRVENEKGLLTLLLTLDEIFSFTPEDAKAFGKLRVALKRKPIPDMDLQIAATCIQNDLILVTRDARHFNDIPHLSLYKAKN